jgi:hypothetical protein
MTSKHKILTILAMLSLLAACGGGSSSSSEGTDVSFKVELKPVEDGSGQPMPQSVGIKQFENSENRSIRIKAGYLVIWSLTLETDCSDASFTSAASWLDWFIGSAQAHAVASPLTLGVPHVIDLTGAESQSITLGSIAPPANDYCGLTTELLKADADTVSLPVTPDMIGLSFYVQGEYLADNATDWISFEIDSGKSLLPARRLFGVAMQLNSSQLNHSVTLQLPYHDWFDGIDFSQISDTSQIDMILSNITASILITP